MILGLDKENNRELIHTISLSSEVVEHFLIYGSLAYQLMSNNMVLRDINNIYRSH
jgi:hypothetical protein